MVMISEYEWMVNPWGKSPNAAPTLPTTDDDVEPVAVKDDADPRVLQF